MSEALVKNMPAVMLYRRHRQHDRIRWSKLFTLFSPASVAVLGFSFTIILGFSYQALSIYTAPEPYSVSNTIQDIRQVIAKLDQDSFIQRLSSYEKYELAQKVQFVSGIINHNQASTDRNQLAVSIVSESMKANVDPLLVTAIVKSESLFKSGAVSHKGARGLMQLMPDTAKFTERNLQKPSWRENGSSLHTADYNLSLGITYLKHLEDSFDGNRELALIAYNWGPGNLKNALKRNSHIPESTRAYARKIMNNHQKWLGELKYLALGTSDHTNRDALATKELA